jgi:hypothetical protein
MHPIKKLLLITLFSIAMGYLESAVVIYLREIGYPDGFCFPLRPLPKHLAVVEIWREAATIIMLLAIGMLAGKNRAERFAWFLFAFAVWDIFYYAFLYVFLGWPQSLLSWDILFLIPVPWVGPVLAPVLLSLTMILFALSINYYSAKGKTVNLSMYEAGLLVVGSLVVIYSFTKDYIHQQGDFLYSNIRKGGSLLADLANYVPAHFSWLMFSLGEVFILLAWFIHIRKARM